MLLFFCIVSVIYSAGFYSGLQIAQQRLQQLLPNMDTAGRLGDPSANRKWLAFSGSAGQSNRIGQVAGCPAIYSQTTWRGPLKIGKQNTEFPCLIEH